MQSLWITLIAGIPLASAAAQSTASPRINWETKGREQEPFGVVSGVAENQDGLVIIADERGQAFYAFDPVTKRTRRFARRGSGPGEVLTPSLVSRGFDGRIYLYDLQHKSILMFDAKLNFISSVRLSKWVTNPKGFAILNDGSFVLSGGMLGSAYSVHVYRHNGELAFSSVRAPETRDSSAALHVAGGPIAAVSTGGFIYSNSAPHTILKFGNGPSFTQIAADSSLIPGIADDFHYEVIVDGRRLTAAKWYYAQSRGVYLLRNGRILNVVTRVYQKDSIWEIWSSTGALLKRVRVQRAYRPYAVTSRGMSL